MFIFSTSLIGKRGRKISVLFLFNSFTFSIKALRSLGSIDELWVKPCSVAVLDYESVGPKSSDFRQCFGCTRYSVQDESNS